MWLAHWESERILLSENNIYMFLPICRLDDSWSNLKPKWWYLDWKIWDLLKHAMNVFLPQRSSCVLNSNSVFIKLHEYSRSELTSAVLHKSFLYLFITCKPDKAVCGRRRVMVPVREALIYTSSAPILRCRVDSKISSERVRSVRLRRIAGIGSNRFQQ